MLAVPLMSEEALLKIIGALDNYTAKHVKVCDQSETWYDFQEELIALGLNGDEAVEMLMHTQIISEFISKMRDALAIFKKVEEIRQDRAKKITLLETNLAKARALSASLEAEIAELKISGP